MGVLSVFYNGNVLSPTPLVQQNNEFIDYGSRWGSTLQIELVGNITGVTGIDAQLVLASYFTGQFGTLEVQDNGSTLYQWKNVVLDEVTFPPNRLMIAQKYPYSIAPYSVRLRAINVPSGVLDPTNEYSMNQGDDGVVSVTHRISARGIRTTAGALTNAITFVQQFTNQNPYNLGSLVPVGTGVLVSVSENIDRATCTYSVQETYKYNTGSTSFMVENWTANISDVMDNEWLTLDVDWRLQGSPVSNNLTQIENNYILDPINKLGQLGFATGNLIQNAYNVVRDTGAATIQIRTSYLSGYNSTDIQGYFDYTVSLSNDMIAPKEDWRCEGDFVCFGPRDYRVSQLGKFKTNTVQGDWRKYLSGLVTASPIYKYHSGNRLFGGHMDVEVQETTGLAQCHATLTTSDGGRPDNLWRPQYTLDVAPNRWTYDLMPSANIEGHYVLQDLQMQTQGHITMSVNASARNTVVGLNLVSGFVQTLSNQYIASGFTTSESYNTGITDVTFTREWLGLDSMSSGLTYTKVAGTTLSDYLRAPGYRFGF